MESNGAAVVRSLLGRGGLNARELERLGRLSQPTVSRALEALRSELFRVGPRRGGRHWLKVPLFGVGASHPVRWITDAGEAKAWGFVHHVAPGVLVLEGPRAQWGPAPDLPWPLAPLRREGFLGQVAAELTALTAVLGASVHDWSPAGHLYAALLAGADLPGALVVGSPPEAPALDARVPEAKRDALYEPIASDGLRRGAPGSSAGGDQPKLLALTKAGHCIVKYAPPHGTPGGVRWSDLLRSEVAALDVLHRAGEPVARATVFAGARRTWLESPRFDRVGVSGRRHAVGLDAIHGAFVGGPRQHWADTCAQLAAQKRLPPDDATRVRRWRAFGRLIATTDLHFGNLSFFVTDFAKGTFSLAPCYDMLPMQYRPTLHEGDLGPTPFMVPTPGADELPVWAEAKKLAEAFWARVADDGECSATWRTLCRENAARVRKA